MGTPEMTTNETQRFEPNIRSAGPAQNVLVARQRIVGMLQDDGERLLNEMLDSARAERSSTPALPPADWPAASVRHCLQLEEGSGHWDFYKPWAGLMLSVTDASYRTDTWVNVEGTGYFKLRVLLSGTLRGRTREVIAAAPEALLYVSPGTSREGYYIAAGEPTRMVVLHCRPHLLTQVLGLEPRDIPAPLGSVLTAGRDATRRRLTPGPEVIQAARRIMESRSRLSPALRERFLQALCTELLLQVLGLLESRALIQSDPSVNSRDAARIYEARDYLSQHYAKPPNIAELARRVGLNRTKLKEIFKQVVGFTIYEYILRLRMERASEMLITGDYDIAQVAYAVGYEYPANFTAAFKRHFGQLPRKWKRRHCAADDLVQ